MLLDIRTATVAPFQERSTDLYVGKNRFSQLARIGPPLHRARWAFRASWGEVKIERGPNLHARDAAEVKFGRCRWLRWRHEKLRAVLSQRAGADVHSC